MFFGDDKNVMNLDTVMVALSVNMRSRKHLIVPFYKEEFQSHFSLNTILA